MRSQSPYLWNPIPDHTAHGSRLNCVTSLTNNHVEKGNVLLSVWHRAAPNQRERVMIDLAALKDDAITSEELDRVAGGIIIIGGLQRYELVAQTSVLDRV